MLGFTITSKKALEATKTALANAQAQAQSQAKKTKQAAIIGGSTTAAAAVVAGAFFFTGGRKINREKIKNFDSVVEERDNAITAKVAADTKISNLETEKKGLESTCELLAGSAYNVQVAAVAATGGTIKENSTFQRACYDHDLLVKKTFNTKSDEEFMKLRKDLFKSFTDSIKELEKLDAAADDADDDADEAETEEDLKAAQNRYNDACKKAGDAKKALDDAKKALDDDKAANPSGDHTEFEKALTDAQENFDKANKELEEADAALKALQNNG